MAREYDPATVELGVNTIKFLAVDAVEKAQSGHPGTPMGLADIAFEIYTRYLRHDPKDPSWLGRDRFVLSCGHASMLLYSMLHLAGYDVSLDDLQAFRQLGSRTPGHPEAGHTAGVEVTTGPLGQGVGNAVGFALAHAMKRARFGEPFEQSRVFCLCSDGDVMEGVSVEASSMAGHLGLPGLIVIYDDNRITIEGETSLAFSEDVGARYEAHGWYVQRIDGHDHGEIRAALDRALAETARPCFIVARTHIAHGAPNAHDTSESHGAPLGAAEIAAAKEAAGWDPERSFHVPEAVRALFAEREAELVAEREAWAKRYAAWREREPEKAALLDQTESRSVPDDLFEKLLAAVPAKADATRNTSGVLMQVVSSLVPSLVGGSADLGPSTKTLVKGGGAVAPRAFEGKNLHFGIREHGMGSICNGLALAGGFVPYGSTFLVFSDYMRPSVRLSALSNLQALWIFTHDSIFLGEDGPTHQPVEHLAALRSIPNLAVVRPADGAEVAAAWTMALSRRTAPTAFALTRQTVPVLARPAGFDASVMLRGAYVLADATGGAPELVLIATGSEVGLAVAARDALEREGKRVRVVSAPCLEIFAQQDSAYRTEVLPPGAARVSIEAGRTDGWYRWIGSEGLAIGIDGFGASAPQGALAHEYGLTAELVTQRVRVWLERRAGATFPA